MIVLSRLNGAAFALNPDLIERAESNPDTVITLVDGTKYVVAESLAELVALIRQYRAGVVADAQHLVGQPESQPPLAGDPRRDDPRHDDPRRDDAHGAEPTAETPQSNVVQLHRRER